MANHQRELPKLPQARMYLKSAQWGFDQLIAGRLSGYAFRFHLIGILASLRAVQHALKAHDATLSDDHKRVIYEWWEKNNPQTVPELKFITTSRNSLLKAGAFRAYATTYELRGVDPPRQREPDEKDYDLGYYDEKGERQDLEADIRRAIQWCDAELTAMDARLPPVYAPE